MGRKLSTTTTSLQSSRNWKKALNYEMGMFSKLWHMLDTQEDDLRRRSKHLHDAVLESALLHTRILADFFLSRTTKEDFVPLPPLVVGHLESLLVLIRVPALPNE